MIWGLDIMAIKVIREGNKDWVPKYKGLCHRCKCVVECSQEDGEYVGSFRSGLEGDFVKIPCPNCKDIIICYRITEQPYYDPRESRSGYWDR